MDILFNSDCFQMITVQQMAKMRKNQHIKPKTYTTSDSEYSIQFDER